MRIRTKTALTFATLSVTALLASSLFTYNFARSELTSNALNRLEIVASTHSNRLHEALEHDRQRSLLITSRTQLRRSLDSFLETGNTGAQTTISKILNDAATPIKSFLWIAVLDPQGNIVATSGALTEDTKLPQQTIARAIQANRPERILLLSEQQRLNQHLIAPLVINGRNIGSVVVQTDSGNMLDVVGDFAGLGASGDSYVLGPATRTGAFQFLTPARFDPAAALRRETESLNGLVDAKALLRSDSALSQGIDYRGQPVFAAATIIQGTDWTLVVKIDQSEVFAPIARLRNFWIAVVVLVLLMVVAISIYLSRLITQPIVALTQKMDRYGHGELSFDPVSKAPYREITRLSQAFERMIKARSEVEIALRQDEQRLRLHREQAPLGMIEWDIDFRVTDWNLAAEKIFGYSRKEALGRHASELLLTTEVIDQVDSIWQDLLKQPGAQHNINQNRTRDGSLLLCEWNNTTLVDEDNQVIAVASMVDDITEEYQRQQEAERFQAALRTWATADYLKLEPTLRLATELTARTLETSITSVWLFDDKQNMAICEDLYVLKKDCHLPTEPHQLNQLPAYQSALKAGRVMVVCDFQNDPRMLEFSGSARDSKQLAAILEAPIRRHGKIVGTFACDHHGETRDWTIAEQEFVSAIASTLSLALEVRETQVAEANLRKNESELRQILESMVDGVITFDAAGRILNFNPAAEGMFGYRAAEMIGKEIICLSPAQQRKRLQAYLKPFMARKLADRSIANAELQGCRKDGESFPLRLSLSELPTADDEKRRFIISCADTTVQKQQEEQLRSTQKMDALGKLTGGLAHDYNNMLHVILSYAGLLEDSLGDEPRLQGFAGEVRHAAQRGAALTRHLLAFSRRQPTEASATDLNNVMEDVRRMLKPMLTVRIKMQLQLTDALWQIRIDKGDLEDAIVNMCINAMHAMPGGGNLTLITSNVPLPRSKAQALGLSAGRYVKLVVADTGIGMDHATQERIFEPFFSTKGDQGTGLGLSQVYGLVQRSSGTIRVSSSPGLGTRISVYFPLYRDDTSSNREPDDTSPMLVATGNETILVVDDEPALLAVTERLLSGQGYNVLCADSGEQALDTLQSEPVSLLLSDIIMPEMNGHQLANAVRRQYPEIKIQLMSGFDGDDLADEPGPSDSPLLYKPFDAASLLQRMRELLD